MTQQKELDENPEMWSDDELFAYYANAFDDLIETEIDFWEDE